MNDPWLGGRNSYLNINSATVVKPNPGRVFSVSIIASGSTASTVNDCLTTATSGDATQILTIPSGTVAGTVYTMYGGWPCLQGIVVAPGTGSVLAVSFS